MVGSVVSIFTLGIIVAAIGLVVCLVGLASTKRQTSQRGVVLSVGQLVIFAGLGTSVVNEFFF